MNEVFNKLKKLVATQKQVSEIVGVPIDRMKKIQEAAKKVSKEIQALKVK